jgi:hypothetical protein
VCKIFKLTPTYKQTISPGAATAAATASCTSADVAVTANNVDDDADTVDADDSDEADALFFLLTLALSAAADDDSRTGAFGDVFVVDDAADVDERLFRCKSLRNSGAFVLSPPPPTPLTPAAAAVVDVVAAEGDDAAGASAVVTAVAFVTAGVDLRVRTASTIAYCCAYCNQLAGNRKSIIGARRRMERERERAITNSGAIRAHLPIHNRFRSPAPSRPPLE